MGSLQLDGWVKGSPHIALGDGLFASWRFLTPFVDPRPPGFSPISAYGASAATGYGSILGLVVAYGLGKGAATGYGRLGSLVLISGLGSGAGEGWCTLSGIGSLIGLGDGATLKGARILVLTGTANAVAYGAGVSRAWCSTTDAAFAVSFGPGLSKGWGTCTGTGNAVSLGFAEAMGWGAIGRLTQISGWGPGAAQGYAMLLPNGGNLFGLGFGFTAGWAIGGLIELNMNGWGPGVAAGWGTLTGIGRLIANPYDITDNLDAFDGEVPAVILSTNDFANWIDDTPYVRGRYDSNRVDPLIGAALGWCGGLALANASGLVVCTAGGWCFLTCLASAGGWGPGASAGWGTLAGLVAVNGWGAGVARSWALVHNYPGNLDGLGFCVASGYCFIIGEAQATGFGIGAAKARARLKAVRPWRYDLEMILAKAVADLLGAKLDQAVLSASPAVTWFDPMSQDAANRFVVQGPNGVNFREQSGNFNVTLRLIAKTRWTQPSLTQDLAEHWLRVHAMRLAVTSVDTPAQLEAFTDGFRVEYVQPGRLTDAAISEGWIETETELRVNCFSIDE